MLKTTMIAAVLLGGVATASAQSWMGSNNNDGWNGRDAYASGRMDYRMNRQPQFQAQSGGNGSPVSAGSLRGSTDRSSPDSPYASGPYGDGEYRPGRY